MTLVGGRGTIGEAEALLLWPISGADCQRAFAACGTPAPDAGPFSASVDAGSADAERLAAASVPDGPRAVGASRGRQ